MAIHHVKLFRSKANITSKLAHFFYLTSLSKGTSAKWCPSSAAELASLSNKRRGKKSRRKTVGNKTHFFLSLAVCVASSLFVYSPPRSAGCQNKHIFCPHFILLIPMHAITLCPACSWLRVRTATAEAKANPASALQVCERWPLRRRIEGRGKAAGSQLAILSAISRTGLRGDTVHTSRTPGMARTQGKQKQK